MKARTFNILTYTLGAALLLPGIFTFCSTGKYVEPTPSFSNTKISAWSKFKPLTYAGVEKLLDSLLIKDARQYYASLDQPYAVIVMQRTFGTTVSQYPIQEWDRNYDKSGIVRMFSGNDDYFLPFKAKIISICYYRHLNGLSCNFQDIKDSLKQHYPLKKTLLGGTELDYNAYYAEEDSITNDHYLKTWQTGDVVNAGYYYEGTSRKRSFSVSYSGVIVSKDSKDQTVEIRITELEVNDKKVLAFVDPRTKSETFAVGRSIQKKPKDITNTSRKEPYRYY
jgi:hypothetical protein